MLITDLKDMCLRTTIVRDGLSRAVIVAPDEYWGLARNLQRKILDCSGVKVEIKRASGVKDADYGDYNLIALGNMLDNPVICRLYNEHYTFVDGAYPGNKGYVLRTVHNPFGYGRNVIIAGGTTYEGVKIAVRKLIGKLEQGKEIVLNPIIDTKSEYNVPLNPNSDIEEKILNKIELELTEGNDQIAFCPALATGFFYYQTGNIRWSSIFKRCFYEYFEKTWRSIRHTPMGMAEFWAWILILVWDLVEESPVFRDSERLEITNKILHLVENASKMSYIVDLKPSHIRWNHETYNALTLLYGANYFMKYYRLERAKEWLHIARICFKGQAKASRSWDEASGYSAITPKHTMNYALFTGDLEYFMNGNAKRIADLAIMIHDNLSNLVPFGDSGSYSRLRRLKAYVPIWAKAAWFYRDGRYKWMIKKITGKKFLWSKSTYREALSTFNSIIYNGAYDVNLKPVMPRDMLGVKALAPVDRMFYEAEDVYGGKVGKKPEWKRTFDKITFRESFDPKREYLLIDGTSTGHHRHLDGNSILWFTDKGRIFLVDSGYTQSVSPKYHNTVMIVRNLKCEDPPRFAALNLLDDLGSLGFTSTSLEDYNGVTWTRNVIWRKSSFFLVFDELKAEEEGDYDFRCLWRVLGDVSPDGTGGLRSKQGNVEFILKNCGDLDSFVIREDMELSQRGESLWAGYRHADGIVKTLIQRVKRKLSAGEKVYFINFFYTKYANQDFTFEIFRVGKSTVCIKGKESAIVGVNGLQINNLRTDASAYYISNKEATLVNATFLKIDRPIFRSNRPVSLSLKDGKGVISAKTDVTVEFYTENKRIIVNGRVAYEPSEDGVVKFHLESGRHKIMIRPSLHLVMPIHHIMRVIEKKKTFEKSLRTKGEINEILNLKFGGAVSSLCSADIDDDGRREILVGLENGQLHLIQDGKGSLLFRAKGKVNVIKVSDVDGDDAKEILLGCEDRRLYLLDRNGNLRWSFLCPQGHLGAAGYVRHVEVADLDGDGQKEIVIAASSWKVHALNSSGKQLWEYEAYAWNPKFLRVCDIDSDGSIEVMVGNDYFFVHVIDSRGRLKWKYRARRPVIYSSAIGDLDDDRYKEIVLAVSDSCLHILDKDGNLKGKIHVGGEPIDVKISDLDKDDRKEIYVGLDAYYIYKLTSTGKTVWVRDVNDIIEGILIIDDGLLAVRMPHKLAVYDSEGIEKGLYITKERINCAVVADKRIIMGTCEGTLKVFDIAN